MLRPAVYIALSRLEEKGLVSSTVGDGTGARGGRPKKYFAVEPEGPARLRESRRALINMWDGLHTVLDEG